MSVMVNINFKFKRNSQDHKLWNIKYTQSTASWENWKFIAYDIAMLFDSEIWLSTIILFKCWYFYTHDNLV